MKQASFSYGNLLVEWDIESEKEMDQGILISRDEENVTATLVFKITIR